jgi:protein-S-isoprenylcysteine O-methyltransferase Ste14
LQKCLLLPFFLSLKVSILTVINTNSCFNPFALDTMSSPAAAIALAAAAYISRICFRRPNPTPPNPRLYDHQLLARILVYGPSVREYILLGLAIPHILLAVLKDPPRALCPNPSHVNLRYITLSPYVIILVGLIILLGRIRIQAFNQLGKSFTFELYVNLGTDTFIMTDVTCSSRARPEKLVKTGLYRHCQHPSYLPDAAITLANYALFGATDGWFACYLPLDMISTLDGVNGVMVLALTAIAVYSLRLRILHEEAMLKETFGREWEEWHAKTARLFPRIW